MLRWRLVLGTLIVAILVGMAWLDHLAEAGNVVLPKGIWLFPVAVFFTVTATREMLDLAAAGGMRPVPWAVYCGNLLLVVGAWLPGLVPNGTETALAMRTTWPLLALAAGVMLVLLSEMRRYEKPGGVMANVAAAAFTLVYVGLMLSFAIHLRITWGVGALASLVVVVKMADTGAYTVGRLIGRHQIAPVLSPKKTVEGAIGALLFACLASWLTFNWLLPWMAPDAYRPEPAWRWIVFGLLASTAGMLGDLAESLIKRDVGRKDSSGWLPGFGGVLDLLDSLLLAAPVAWFCWAVGLVGG